MKTKNNKRNKLWFKAKMFGWGWRPVSWQGWILTLLYAADIGLNAGNLNGESNSVSDFLLKFGFHFIIITILFLVVCYAKGERPRWRWGR